MLSTFPFFDERCDARYPLNSAARARGPAAGCPKKTTLTVLSLREPPLGCEVESHIRNDKKDFLALAPPRGHPTAGRRILSKEANELMN